MMCRSVRLRIFNKLVFVLTMLITGFIFSAHKTSVYLNGTPETVYFNDGDSFKILTGEFASTRARLVGFNTLETYGPVHQWGGWTAKELYFIAKAATKNARHGTWHCFSKFEQDTYGRILWSCPDLAKSQISKGLAHVMTPDKTLGKLFLLRAQRKAIKNKVGMWAKGAPDYILTSVHSINEEFTDTAYNRYVSTHDGHSEKVIHSNPYNQCENICSSTQLPKPSGVTNLTTSCLLYVDYGQRYGHNKAQCLRW